MRYGTFGRRDYCRIFAFLATLLAGAPSSVQAEELHFILNGKAVHLGDPPAGQKFNEKNWGAGLQYDFNPTEDGKWIPFVTAAGFNDSNKNPSYYAGGGVSRRFQPTGSSIHYDLGVVGFLMTRQDFKGGDPFPGILPVFSMGTDSVALNVTYVPDVMPKSVPLLFFQLKFRLATF